MKIGFRQSGERNHWAELNPVFKLSFALMISFLTLLVPHPLFGYFIFLFTALILRYVAKLPWRYYFRAYRVPLVFILISMVTIVFEFGAIPVEKELLWVWGEGRGVFVTRSGLDNAFSLLGKVLGSLAGLFALALTSSMIDILHCLKNLHFPTVFLTMMEMLYRFSMSIYSSFKQLITAQELRLAYGSLRRGIPALAQALGRVFSNLLKRSRNTATALDLRLFRGELITLPKSYPSMPKEEREILFASALILFAALIFTFLL